MATRIRTVTDILWMRYQRSPDLILMEALNNSGSDGNVEYTMILKMHKT